MGYSLQGYCCSYGFHPGSTSQANGDKLTNKQQLKDKGLILSIPGLEDQLMPFVRDIIALPHMEPEESEESKDLIIPLGGNELIIEYDSEAYHFILNQIPPQPPLQQEVVFYPPPHQATGFAVDTAECTNRLSSIRPAPQQAVPAVYLTPHPIAPGQFPGMPLMADNTGSPLAAAQAPINLQLLPAYQLPPTSYINTSPPMPLLQQQEITAEEVALPQQPVTNEPESVEGAENLLDLEETQATSTPSTPEPVSQATPNPYVKFIDPADKEAWKKNKKKRQQEKKKGKKKVQDTPEARSTDHSTPIATSGETENIEVSEEASTESKDAPDTSGQDGITSELSSPPAPESQAPPDASTQTPDADTLSTVTENPSGVPVSSGEVRHR